MFLDVLVKRFFHSFLQVSMPRIRLVFEGVSIEALLSILKLPHNRPEPLFATKNRLPRPDILFVKSLQQQEGDETAEKIASTDLNQHKVKKND